MTRSLKIHVVKRLIPILLLFIFAAKVHAQSPALDSISHRYDSLAKAKTHDVDSTSLRVNGKIDSAQLKVNRFLNPSLNVDSSISRLPSKRNHSPDSVQAIHELDSMKRGMANKIDSLKALNLPTDRYQHKLDSLKGISLDQYILRAQAKGSQVQARVDQRINDVEDEVNKPISNTSAKLNDKLNIMRKEGGDKANLPTDVSEKMDLPDADLRTSVETSTQFSVPKVDLKPDKALGQVDNPLEGQLSEAREVKSKFNDVKSLPQEQIEKVKSSETIQHSQEKITKANEVTDRAQSYEGDAKAIATGNVAEVKNVADEAQVKVQNIDKLKALEQQSSEVNKAKGMIPSGNKPDELKTLAKKQVMTYATDQFKGKDAAIKSAMSKMKDLKVKYSDMPTLEQATRRVKNEMHGKPFVERIAPGLTLQIQKWNTVQLDLNPNISYRLSGVWNTGVGWNERLSFQKWNRLASVDRIFGPRVFTSVIIKRGFGIKAEVERMNTWVQQTVTFPDGNRRVWVWSVFVGIKKEYTLSKKIRGNFQTLYNVYDDHANSPYADKLVVRIGFEWPLKDKK